MKVNILNKGDKVISVTHEFIAVRRKNGETDIIGLAVEKGGIKINLDHILTIGYGDADIEFETENGVVITNF